MSEKQKQVPIEISMDMIAVDVIWDLLDREYILPELVAHWPGVNAITVRNQPIPAHDSYAGAMPIAFAYHI